ncbi:hypothetical protein ACFB49_38360 [Sphingomonas sp. DBB INV C78]
MADARAIEQSMAFGRVVGQPCQLAAGERAHRLIEIEFGPGQVFGMAAAISIKREDDRQDEDKPQQAAEQVDETHRA